MASNPLLSSDGSMKCKRRVVSIEKKLEICCRHKMGQSDTSLSKEYGLGKSTIHDIVQSEDRLTEYTMLTLMLTIIDDVTIVDQYAMLTLMLTIIDDVTIVDHY